MNLFSHIIAIDPSGAFYEGQGTTGICVFNTVDMYVQQHLHISATKYETAHAYWNAHIDTINALRKKYPKSGIVIEDYLLYGACAQDQVNSRMETSQLLGILKYYLCNKSIMHRLETASAALPRWTNDILLHKGYIKQKGKSFTDPKGSVLNRHELDAVRHAVHNATFYNMPEGVSQWKTKY